MSLWTPTTSRRETTDSMIAALYVEPDGSYANLEGVDVWDEARDARTYAGPHPVVAHPPCARWGSYWWGGPGSKTRRKMGDDGGCLAAAIASVRKYGGVLEHPRNSHGWGRFEINKPPHTGGWVPAGSHGGWTCCVEQGHYGHEARKPTWLVVYGLDPPRLIWGRSEATMKVDPGFKTTEARKLAAQNGWIYEKRLSDYGRIATPEPFRDLLLSMARSVR